MEHHLILADSSRNSWYSCWGSVFSLHFLHLVIMFYQVKGFSWSWRVRVMCFCIVLVTTACLCRVTIWTERPEDNLVTLYIKYTQVPPSRYDSQAPRKTKSRFLLLLELGCLSHEVLWLSHSLFFKIWWSSTATSRIIINILVQILLFPLMSSTIGLIVRKICVREERGDDSF